MRVTVPLGDVAVEVGEPPPVLPTVVVGAELPEPPGRHWE